MIVVPDASVILKWVLQRDDEPDTDRALAVLHAYLEGHLEIRLPTLWRYEVGNVLGLKQPRIATEAMATLLGYDFTEEPLGREYCLDVLGFLRQMRGVSFYDAAYHVLAARHQGLYLTADRAYARKAGRRPDLTVLADWTAPS